MKFQVKQCLSWMKLIAAVCFGAWCYASFAYQYGKPSLNDIQDDYDIQGRKNNQQNQSSARKSVKAKDINPLAPPLPQITVHNESNQNALHNELNGSAASSRLDAGPKESTSNLQPEDSVQISFLNPKPPPQMTNLGSDWQVVKEQQLYVYSAYHDGRQNGVVVIAIVNMHQRGTYKCALWYNDKPEHPQLTDAYLDVLPEGHGKRYGAAYLNCKLSTASNSSPDFVSIHTDVSEVQGKAIESIRNLISVTNVHENRVDKKRGDKLTDIKLLGQENAPNIKTQGKENTSDWNTESQENKEYRKHKFTICVSPLHHNVSPNQLVEFIEINRLFGADHFVLYTMLTNTSALQPYLDYYIKNQLVSIYPWHIPEGINSLHYHGQVATLNDCLYKSMYVTKYTVMVDLDEIIVPTKHTDWTEIIDQQSLGMDTSSIGSYSFQCVFFKTEWPPDQTYLNNTLVTKYDIQTLLKTKRERKLFPHGERSKIMVIPERVGHVGVHIVMKYWNRKYRTVNVPSTEAMMFHYRNWEEPNKPIELEEKRMHKFADDIIHRVRSVHDTVRTQT